MTNYLLFIKHRRLLLGLILVAIAFATTGCVSRASVATLAPTKTTIMPAEKGKQAIQVAVYPGKFTQVLLPYSQLFNVGKAVVKPQAYALLDKVYHLTRSFAYPQIKLITDRGPSALAEPARHALAMKRANAIAAYFWAQGLPREQITLIDGAAQRTKAINPYGIVPVLSQRNIELQISKIE